jgi:endonuclease YncB( thermonuclease family)
MHRIFAFNFPQKLLTMMKILTGLISSLTLLSLNLLGLSQVQAQTQGFEFQNVPVSFSGTGCPQGTVQGVLNGDTLSIIFSAFEAKASRPNVVSKSCNFRIGLNVPSGFNVQPISVKYSGFADVPRGGSADLSVKILFQGREVPTTDNLNQTFRAGFSDVWSKHGGGIVLNTINACRRPVSSVFGINTNLTARATNIPPGQETQIRIEPIDTAIGEILFQIKFEFNPC